MIYAEQTPAESDSKKLKKSLLQRLKNPGEIEGLLAFLQSQVFIPLQSQIKQMQLVSAPQMQDLFFTIKQSLNDLHARLRLCITCWETVGYSAPHFAERLQDLRQCQMECKRLIEKMHTFDKQILATRKSLLTTSFAKPIEKATQLIEAVIKQQLSLQATKEERHMHALLMNHQGRVLKLIGSLFESHLSKWEEGVVHEGRGLLYSNPSRIPFNILYTVKGTIYITLEAGGHFLGKGESKLGIRAIDFKSGELVALLKTTSGSLEMESEEEEEKLRGIHVRKAWAESEILHQLQGSTGIVSLRDRLIFSLGGKTSLYLIEDYFPHRSLFQYLHSINQQTGVYASFSSLERNQIAKQLLLGLQAVHALGVVHNDIKPDNILLDLTSSAKAVLSDFNLAFAISDLTKRARLWVTPIWSSPEKARLSLTDNPSTEAKIATNTFASDIWSLGLVLRSLASDQFHPWIKEKNVEVVFAQVAELKKGWATLADHPWNPLLDQMLDPDPKRRIDIAKALRLFEEIQ